MKKLTKLKIRYITKIYNVFCEHRSIEEIHKELRRSTFKDFYVPLEFKKVFYQATSQIKKLVDEEERSGGIIIFPKTKFDRDERNSRIFTFINKVKLENKANLIVNKVARDFESDAKEEMLNKDIDKFSKEKKVFVLLSRHKDCALDHLAAQGKVCYLENYKNILGSDYNAILEVEKYIENNRLFSFEYVLGKPIWFITRPNCRHFYEPVSLGELNKFSVEELLKKKNMDLAVGNRKILQTIKHDTRKEFYNEANVRNIILTYQRRLELHKYMYKSNRSNLLRSAIVKDKLLIDKWEKYYKSIIENEQNFI